MNIFIIFQTLFIWNNSITKCRFCTVEQRVFFGVCVTLILSSWLPGRSQFFVNFFWHWFNDVFKGLIVCELNISPVSCAFGAPRVEIILRRVTTGYGGILRGSRYLTVWDTLVYVKWHFPDHVFKINSFVWPMCYIDFFVSLITVNQLDSLVTLKWEGVWWLQNGVGKSVRCIF